MEKRTNGGGLCDCLIGISTSGSYEGIFQIAAWQAILTLVMLGFSYWCTECQELIFKKKKRILEHVFGQIWANLGKSADFQSFTDNMPRVELILESLF